MSSIIKEVDRNMEGMEILVIHQFNHKDQIAYMLDGKKLDILKIQRMLLIKEWISETMIILIDMCFTVQW